jgi:hypothetical protein
VEAMKMFFVCLMLLSVEAMAGGMSGGGGNVLVSRESSAHTNIELTARLIDEAHSQIIPYLKLKREQIQNDENAAPILEKLFALNPQILNLIESAAPNILMSRPCLDDRSRKYDGSARPHAEAPLCISAWRIGHKLKQSEVTNQAIALLLHEYSELSGFSDREAIELQTYALKDLNAN